MLNTLYEELVIYIILNVLYFHAICYLSFFFFLSFFMTTEHFLVNLLCPPIISSLILDVVLPVLIQIIISSFY